MRRKEIAKAFGGERESTCLDRHARVRIEGEQMGKQGVEAQTMSEREGREEAEGKELRRGGRWEASGIEYRYYRVPGLAPAMSPWRH